jgi:cytochrome c oxidase subunit III
MGILTQKRRGVSLPPPPSRYGGGSGGSGSSFPISTAHVGTYVLLTAIIMLFAGLSSAYIVLHGVPTWQNITLPRLVWGNTLILLASSIAAEFARSAVRKDQQRAFKQWLGISGLLGLVFLAGQFLAWRQLVAAGVYLSTTIHSSFFYLLTGVHAVHLAGGLIGLAIVLQRALANRLTSGNHEALKVWALYWHFMDVVWIYCFLLLLLA